MLQVRVRFPSGSYQWAGVSGTKIKSERYFNVFVCGADTFLNGAEGLGVAHLAELAGHARSDAAQDRGRLLRRRFYHRFSFLVSGQQRKGRYQYRFI